MRSTGKHRFPVGARIARRWPFKDRTPCTVIGHAEMGVMMILRDGEREWFTIGGVTVWSYKLSKGAGAPREVAS